MNPSNNPTETQEKHMEGMTCFSGKEEGFSHDKVIDFMGIYSEHGDNSRLSEFKKEIQQLFNQ